MASSPAGAAKGQQEESPFCSHAIYIDRRLKSFCQILIAASSSFIWGMSCKRAEFADDEWNYLCSTASQSFYKFAPPTRRASLRETTCAKHHTFRFLILDYARVMSMADWK